MVVVTVMTAHATNEGCAPALQNPSSKQMNGHGTKASMNITGGSYRSLSVSMAGKKGNKGYAHQQAAFLLSSTLHGIGSSRASHIKPAYNTRHPLETDDIRYSTDFMYHIACLC